MLVFLVDWLNLLVRWAHFVFGVGWIGASFYFVWLDLSLRQREKMNPGVYGTSWLVHGGGFYHVEKYSVAPARLPEDLHWFIWEAYLTWVTGFALLILQYYFNATAYLIDPQVLDLAPREAIAISVASLAAGWLIYDGLCRSPIGSNPALLGLAVFAEVCLAAYLYSHVFSGRAALIHVGALVGTMMAANVFMVIIPNQRKMTASLLQGEDPDPRLGQIGKQRSTHNNYLTLPVLLMMVSGHYPMLYSHPHTWLIVAFILVIGAMVRHFINRADAGDAFPTYSWALLVAALGLVGAIFLTQPEPRSQTAIAVPSDRDVLAILDKHCVMCHSPQPSHDGFEVPPADVALDTIPDLRRFAERVMAQAVRGDAMPLGNETGMTDQERDQLGAWIEDRQ
ncbi:urate hydroxylase PuuD [Microbaculum marinisediminis]|uniref:Urate hydroxylase PuuD n=1 Tax=Microbaculum marinisediminis TaxID=2931392 RepID=A0AAW5R4Q2_9HYPH|nr:urate hydroxylase PuuD [Microbaculum sp. A6E488]MCT8974112.1 urate hydroxylase PuuD [Microbaculum sp. A6E488]